MSKLAHSHPNGLLVECFQCGRLIHEDDADDRASRLAAEPICADCAPQVIADNGQFGVGA